MGRGMGMEGAQGKAWAGEMLHAPPAQAAALRGPAALATKACSAPVKEADLAPRACDPQPAPQRQ